MSKRGMTPKQAELLRVQKGIDRGTKLRKARVKKGMSQRELSTVTGVPIQSVRRYEQIPMAINSAKLKTLIAFCLALDCHIDDIIEGKELLHKYRATK